MTFSPTDKSSFLTSEQQQQQSVEQQQLQQQSVNQQFGHELFPCSETLLVKLYIVGILTFD